MQIVWMDDTTYSEIWRIITSERI